MRIATVIALLGSNYFYDIYIKATRNTVPIPRHWCFKRKYLQGKRGIEKSPFELPDFIKVIYCIYEISSGNYK